MLYEADDEVAQSEVVDEVVQPRQQIRSINLVNNLDTVKRTRITKKNEVTDLYYT